MNNRCDLLSFFSGDGEFDWEKLYLVSKFVSLNGTGSGVNKLDTKPDFTL